MEDPRGEEFFRHNLSGVDDAKKDFPIFSLPEHQENVFIYFDSAATALKPKEVIDAMSNFYLYHYGTVHRAIYPLAAKATETYQHVREEVRRFLGAKSSDEIIFTKGTTESLNLVARSFAGALLQAGDEIFISAAEHHANIVPWQMIALEKGLHLKVIPILENGALDLKTFKQMLSSKTKLISIAYITNTTGVINPVEEVIALAHKVGAKVVLDAAQAVGHQRINVQELQVDFLAFSAHKIYGPTGVGVLYGKQELLDKIPPYQGGGDMIEKVTFERTTYQKPPLRFEAGTPMIAEVIGMGAAIRYIESLGLKKIQEHDRLLLAHATKKLREIPGLRILGNTSNQGPIITFSIEGFHPLDVGTILGLKGVSLRTGKMCAEPLLARFGLESAMRISFGVYNNIGEIDKFIHLLKESMVLLNKEISY